MVKGMVKVGVKVRSTVRLNSPLTLRTVQVIIK